MKYRAVFKEIVLTLNTKLKMKKFLLSISLIFAVLISSAQITMNGSGAAVTNTGTGECSLAVKNSYKIVAIQLKVVKTSGTVAGTVTLQGSIDGTNYETVLAAATVNNAATFTATDVATQVKTFIINNNPYLYYKLSYTGVGTMVATLSGYVITRE